MNPIDDQLNRLFRAAAQARTDAVAVPPYGLETRVMAEWRAAKPAGGWNMPLLVRGLIFASVIMAASLWPVVVNSNNPFSESLQLADSTLPSDTTP